MREYENPPLQEEGDFLYPPLKMKCPKCEEKVSYQHCPDLQVVAVCDNPDCPWVKKVVNT